MYEAHCNCIHISWDSLNINHAPVLHYIRKLRNGNLNFLTESSNAVKLFNSRVCHKPISRTWSLNYSFSTYRVCHKPISGTWSSYSFAYFFNFSGWVESQFFSFLGLGEFRNEFFNFYALGEFRNDFFSFMIGWNVLLISSILSLGKIPY